MRQRGERSEKRTGINLSIPFVASIAFFAFIAFLHAGQSDVGTSAAQVLKIGIGNAKALALGKSYVALADGIESLGFNPAGLAQSNSQELAFGISEWIEGMRGHYMAYGQPHLRSNFAFNVAYFTLGDFDVRDDNGLPLSGNNIFVRTGYVSAGFAWSLPTEQVFMGVGAKGVFEDYALSSSVNFAGDWGILWKKSSSFQVGASLLNISPSAERIPWSARGGIAARLHDYLLFSFDLIQDRDSDLRAASGFDIGLPPVEEVGSIFFRLGYATTDDQGESSLGMLKKFSLHRTSGISFGFGMESESETLYNMALDYAIVPLGALGTTHHIALKFRF